MRKRAILITGGLGYIGSHFCKYFSKKKISIVVIDNLSNSSKVTYNELKKIMKKKLFFFNFDINNKKKLEEVFNKFNFYLIIHLASLKSVPDSLKHPRKYISNNLGITKNILKCMKKFSFTKQIIFSSSAAVYNKSNSKPFRETGNVKSNNPYAKSKILCENLIKEFCFKNNVCGICFRYFNVIGIDNKLQYKISNNKNQNIFDSILNSLETDRVFNIYGKNYNTPDGTCIRDYIDMKDLFNAHLNSLVIYKRKKSDEIKNFYIINLGSGKSVSVLQIIKKLKKKVNIKYKFSNKRKGDLPVAIADIGYAKKILNWEPKITLSQSLDNYCKYISKKI